METVLKSKSSSSTIGFFGFIGLFLLPAGELLVVPFCPGVEFVGEVTRL
jgi:hypothetical protein